MCYYLEDDIYPPWAILISGYSTRETNKQRYFTKEWSRN
jgi:hypothetical protein